MDQGNLHERLERPDEVVGSSDRMFGIVFTVFFALVALFLAWVEKWTGASIFAALSGLFLLVAMVRASLLAPLNRLWTKFGLLLHKVINPIVMAMMFFVVIAPIGMAMRLFGWDALKRRLDPAAESYWIDRDPPGPAREGMTDQF
ncbi:MAG: hypothetical protein ACPGOY_03100 [Rhodospirillaceae bacterium]